MNTFHAVNPATGETLEPAFRESSVADVDHAFRDADVAFVEYAQWPGTQRAEFLRRIAHEIEGIGAELSSRAQVETGLPTVRLEGERARTTHQLRMVADAVAEGSWVGARIDRADATRVPLPRPDVRRVLVPLGPVAVFGASNFPLAFGAAGNDVAAALGAGCSVVYKAHPAQPGTSQLIADAVRRAIDAVGAPAGVFSMVQGWSTDVGMAMVRHPLARAVGFTGSLRAGRALFDAAAARPEPIPVFAEMGSVNPVFLFPSAVQERGAALANMLAQSITQGVGQFCTNPGVIIAVRDAHFETLRAQLEEALAAIAPGVPLYARLAESFRDGVARAEACGASVASSTTDGDDGSRRMPPTRMRPTLLVADGDAFIARAELREEIFGPVSMLVGVRDCDDFTRVAAAIEGQLTATLFASMDDLTTHADLLRRLERKVGRLVVNNVPTGVEVSPAMQHGGPYPASTDARSTSIGTASLDRFVRPVCYQGFPDAALPVALRHDNPLHIWRLVDGALTRDPA